MNVAAVRAAPRLNRKFLPGFRPDPFAVWSLLKGSSYRFWFDGSSSIRRTRATVSPRPGWLSGIPEFSEPCAALAWGRPVWIFQGKNFHGEVSENGSIRRFSFNDPLAVLRDLLGRDDPGEFNGGAVGFWGYESAQYFENTGVFPEGEIADFVWVMPEYWLVWDRKGAWLLQQSAGDGSRLEDWCRRLRTLPSEPESGAAPAEPGSPDAGRRGGGPSVVEGDFRWEQPVYMKGVRRVLRYIAAGDVYQANLTHGINLPWPERTGPERLFRRLRAMNPSPYATLFEFPDFSLVGCSPELLLRVRGRRVETRPIAGTRPRGPSAREDRRLSGELLLNLKERAEHVMLVDLERNDLGRVCRPGTVRVSEKMVLEKYSHVIHIVSQVEGTLQAGRDGFDAVRALFPGGTITGCPKIRCMEILRELERERRGPFFGSAGWVGRGGDMDLNILIRTALLRRNRLSLRVGAGIVADSDPDKEYDETLHKAGALVEAYNSIYETS